MSNNVQFDIRCELTITALGNSVQVVRDTNEHAILTDRIDYDIPEWLNANCDGCWGYIQAGFDVYYWFTEADDAMLFKMRWMGDEE